MITNLSTEVSTALLFLVAIPVIAWLRSRVRNKLLSEELRVLRQSAAKHQTSKSLLESELEWLRQAQARSEKEMAARLSDLDSVTARLHAAESELAAKSYSLSTLQPKIEEYEKALESIRSESRKGEELRKYLHEQLVAAAVRQNEEVRRRESLQQQIDSRASQERIFAAKENSLKAKLDEANGLVSAAEKRARQLELMLLQEAKERERIQAELTREVATRDAAVSDAQKEITELSDKVSTEEEFQKKKLWLESHEDEVRRIASYHQQLDSLAAQERMFAAKETSLKAQLDEASGLAAAAETRARHLEFTLQIKTRDHERVQSELSREVATRDARLIDAQREIAALSEKVSTEEEFHKMRLWLETHEDELELAASGLYSVTLDPSTPDDLKQELTDIKQQLATMIRDKTAVICSTRWEINGSQAEGTRATKNYRRIMLRTFNADADSCLALVRWNNIEKCVSRLKASFDYVNELGATHFTRLQQPYLDARIRQLHLMHRYKEALHRQKEAMRARRLAEAEELRANREIERARLEAELEEKRYAKALARAREEAGFLLGEERDKMLRIVADLEAKLSAASALKQRAISMAQITKAGFVYVVSNLGSFGSDVLKIGMTRRIDPQDRIRELGGASVPFHFDVHAMIYSENAPALENSFHRRFARHRINLANGRKEFFRVGLEEVIRFAQELSLAAEFSTTPEARDYHLSSAMREKLLGSLSDDELNARLDAMLSSSAQEFAPESDEEELEEA